MDSNAPSPSISGGSSSSSAAPNGVSPSPAAVAAAGPPPFLSKTYEMVDDPATDAIVSWGAGNNSFVVWNTPEFARDLLPKYFKHNNFSSFVRQLNTYGFRKIDPDRWEFANEGFLRGQKHLLKTITRRKSSHSHTSHSTTGPHAHQSTSHINTNNINNNNVNNNNNNNNPSLASCVEVGKFGLEEEIERLKRDKNVLMQELVRLRQQQQSTDHQLQTLGKRLQGMETRQQQMMSFLAKAMQSPGFLAQFMTQNDPNRRIVSSKKRRLPKQTPSNPNPNPNFNTNPNGQIVKYQPLINEAAKAMLMKIMNMEINTGGNTSNPNPNPSSGFLLENSSFEPNPSRSSGVTLAEVCNNPPEIQSPDSLINPNLINPNPSPNTASNMEFDSLEMDSINGFNIPDPDLFLNPIMEDSIDSDELMYADNEEKLPGIIDSFWEQFLNSDEIESNDNNNNENIINNGINNDNVVNNNNNNGENMKNLTEQMGMLSSDHKG